MDSLLFDDEMELLEDPHRDLSGQDLYDLEAGDWFDARYHEADELEDSEWDGAFETLEADAWSSEAVFEGEPEVIPPDTRKVISNTTRTPFRFVCHLSNGCTGTLVAPNKVLTSAHCVYSRRSKRETWRGRAATPGRNGSRAPYGQATVVRADYPRSYRKAPNYNDAWPHDYAVLTLDRSLRVPGGAFSRLRVIEPKILLRVKVNTAGYPGHGGRRQYWTYNRIVRVSGARMRHVLDTKPGQSGSPIWLRWRNVRSIVGIHKAGFSGSPQQNRGVAFTRSNLAQINGWIRG